MVSALDSAQCFSSPRCTKWVPAKMLGVSLRWTSIPSRGEQQYSQPLHANETGVKGLLTQRTTYKIQLYSSHNSSSTRNYYRLLSVSCLYTYTDVSFWLFLFQSFGIGRKVKKNEKLITMIIMIIQRSQSFTMD